MTAYPYLTSQRCGAKTKRNLGATCRAPAVRGKNRCRIHGGAKGSGAQHGNKNALKHGNSTAEIKATKREVHETIRMWKNFQNNEFDY